MKTPPILLVPSSVLILTLIACGLRPAGNQAPSDTDVAGTVSAAMMATNTAEAGIAATIQVAVAATNAAVAQPSPTPSLVLTATDTPTPEPPGASPTEAPPPTTVDTSAMSEEELAAAIDAAVAAAVMATDEAARACTDAGSDGTLTYEETVNVEVVLAGAEEALALAEALIADYYDTYGTYASDALDMLEEIEDDLEAMLELVELIAEVVPQGSEAASTAIEQVLEAAGAVDINAAELQAQTQGWQAAVQAELENRAAGALTTQPSQVASDRLGAVQSAFTYLETARASLADGAITPRELSEIAQAGANASASIQAQGGPQLQNLADSIDGLTAQIARGELPQAKGGLDALEASLPRRP